MTKPRVDGELEGSSRLARGEGEIGWLVVALAQIQHPLERGRCASAVGREGHARGEGLGDLAALAAHEVGLIVADGAGRPGWAFFWAYARVVLIPRLSGPGYSPGSGVLDGGSRRLEIADGLVEGRDRVLDLPDLGGDLVALGDEGCLGGLNLPGARDRDGHLGLVDNEEQARFLDLARDELRNHGVGADVLERVQGSSGHDHGRKGLAPLDARLLAGLDRPRELGLEADGLRVEFVEGERELGLRGLERHDRALRRARLRLGGAGGSAGGHHEEEDDGEDRQTEQGEVNEPTIRSGQGGAHQVGLHGCG